MLFGLLFWVWIISRSSIHKTKAVKNICVQEKFIFRLTFIIQGLALAGFQTTRPCLQQVNLYEPTVQLETSTWSAVNLKNMWSWWAVNLSPQFDTGQWIPCFDRCQLVVKWMSNIKEGCYKPRVHVNLLAGVWPPSSVTPLLLSLRAHKQYSYV